MKRISHGLFSLGVASTVAFILDINVFFLPVILSVYYFIGAYPDIDTRFSIEKRGAVHSLLYFILVTFISSFAIFYFYFMLSIPSSSNIFEIDVTNMIPTFFIHLGNLDVDSMLNDTFFKLLAFFFFSYISHFFLDVLTPINVGTYRVNGNIKTESDFSNNFFLFSGISGLVTSLVMISLRFFGVITLDWLYWIILFFGVHIGITIVILILLLVKKSKNNETNLKCFKIDNKIDICIPKGKCFQIGPDKDDKICNVFDDTMI